VANQPTQTPCTDPDANQPARATSAHLAAPTARADLPTSTDLAASAA
jgi:hypothetical protein